MILNRKKLDKTFTDLDNIYDALCAEDMDGKYRANYILQQVHDLNNILDPKGRRRKRYENRKSRIRNPE